MSAPTAPDPAAEGADGEGGSLGYATRLSFREDVGGGLGAQEYLDSPDDVDAKAQVLAAMIRKAKSVVVFTGAGISTACGIPDFRGPSGVWTLQRKGLAAPRATVRFDQALPSLTHMALVAMHRAGFVHCVVSQNVDCLHIRSGLPRAALAEVHGNCFVEVCDRCATEYVRDYEVPSVGLRRTGTSCEACGSALRDQCLDWDSELPARERSLAETATAGADLVLCLGTSLRITPACDMPTRATRRGGELAIVNLQKTPKDKRAAVVVRARVDGVMARVVRLLQVDVPPYERTDRLRLGWARRPAFLAVHLRSVHHDGAPLHWLRSARLRTGAGGGEKTVTAADGWAVELPLPEGADRLGKLHAAFEVGLPGSSTEVRRAFNLSRAPEDGGDEWTWDVVALPTARREYDLDKTIAESTAPLPRAAPPSPAPPVKAAAQRKKRRR